MPTDYCRIFTDHVDHLYTLSLLLTADHGKAEECLVAGLEDCVHGNPVFREWAQAWAVRTVIKNAIRIISPSRNEATTTADTATEPISEADTLALAIMELPPFDRFVYVMSLLERYSDRECSVLLDCTLEDIKNARANAFERLAGLVCLGGQQAPDLSMPVLSPIPPA